MIDFNAKPSKTPKGHSQKITFSRIDAGYTGDIIGLLDTLEQCSGIDLNDMEIAAALDINSTLMNNAASVLSAAYLTRFGVLLGQRKGNEYPHRYTVSVIGPEWSYSGELAGFDNLELAELFRDTMTEKQPLNDGGHYAVTDWQSESKDADAPSDESETNPTADAPWYIEDGHGQVICTGLDAKDADAMNEFIREHDSEYMVVYNTTDGLPF